MDTCSIGRVIDALMLVPTLPAYASTFTDDVVVVDGPWLGSDMPSKMVLIGLLTAGDGESGGDQQPRTMGAGGAGTIQEDYGLVCQTFCWVGDADAGAQKEARDLTIGLFSGFELAIRENRTLDGLYVPPGSGQLPELWVERNGLTQTDDDFDMGRFAAMQFTVHVRNRLVF